MPPEVEIEEVTFEWPYLLLIGVAIVSVYFLPVELFHKLFLLVGATLTIILFLIVGKLKPFVLPAFLLQIGAGLVLLGLPTIVRPALLVTPFTILTVGVIAEETMRIASYKWFAYYGAWLGIIGSSITFAIMHVFWFGWEEKLFAITAGAILSLLLGLFRSETACVVTHLLFNLKGLGYLIEWQYFAIAGLMIAIGLLLIKR